MATQLPPLVPLGDDDLDAALQQKPWRKRFALSSVAERADAFLGHAGFDKGPWLTVVLAAGIAAWFVLPDAASWV
ncbi:MAG: metal-binding protein, partial [Alteraurantiacibacter sp.]